MADGYRLVFREATDDGEGVVDGVCHISAADVAAVRRHAGFSSPATPNDVAIDPDGGLRVTATVTAMPPPDDPGTGAVGAAGAAQARRPHPGRMTRMMALKAAAPTASTRRR